MSAITTHVLDVSIGRPATGVETVLEQQGAHEQWTLAGRGETDADGRLASLMAPNAPLVAGTYRLTFRTKEYFDRAGVRSFYPYVAIVFEVTSPGAHYHVPLLVSPFGYSTYRGS